MDDNLLAGRLIKPGALLHYFPEIILPLKSFYKIYINKS
jgi:hypothetical protein